MNDSNNKLSRAQYIKADLCCLSPVWAVTDTDSAYVLVIKCLIPPIKSIAPARCP